MDHLILTDNVRRRFKMSIMQVTLSLSKSVRKPAPMFRQAQHDNARFAIVISNGSDSYRNENWVETNRYFMISFKL
jgi:hypothetical protein